MNLTRIARLIIIHFYFKNTWSIIHCASKKSSKCQINLVRRWIANTPSIELIATSSLTSQKVRISTTQTRRSHWFMSIHHNSTVSSLLKYTIIMIHHPLSIMILATRDNTTNITRFNRMIAILFHKIKSFVNTTFVISCRP